MKSDDMPKDASRSYHVLVTDFQSTLYAFISALMMGNEDARDVLQDTNLVLWEKASSYDPKCDFASWAYRIAHFQVLAYRKRRQRSRLVFSEELMSLLADEFQSDFGDLDDRVEALQQCLKALPNKHRELICRRYEQEEAVSEIATNLSRSANAISLTLHRIRKVLLDCVSRNATLKGA